MTRRLFSICSKQLVNCQEEGLGSNLGSKPAFSAWPVFRVPHVLPPVIAQINYGANCFWANHHDGELSPPMMKGACGGVSGRVPVRETSSEAAVLSLAYFLTPFTVTPLFAGRGETRKPFEPFPGRMRVARFIRQRHRQRRFLAENRKLWYR
jgi:hypothetical protein